MKKVSLIFKEASEQHIKSKIKDSSAFFLVKYSGLSSPDLTVLRQSLKSARANMFVVKNSVAKRALKDSGLPAMLDYLQGPCGLVFTKEEPIDASKVLCSFSKEHEQLKLQTGYFADKLLAKNDIEALAKLPSKEVLRVQVVGVLNAPMASLVILLNQTLRKFVYCLDRIRLKKNA
jgi:large subunit ribosomal protein L10